MITTDTFLYVVVVVELNEKKKKKQIKVLNHIIIDHTFQSSI